ncbi:MAG: sodium:proton antiporter [Desulfurococcaceae archaeon]
MALCALLSIYGIVGRRSLTKKLISLTILSDTSFVLYILIGYRFVHPSVPPIYTEYSQGYVAYLSRHAVDPLPQALVLTGVVIGMAVNALIAFGIIQAYRLCGTTDAKLLVEATKREAGVE